MNNNLTTKQVGYLLLVVSLFSFTFPLWGDALVSQSMGMGFSTRDEMVSVQSGGYSTFEVGRIYNTGDRIIHLTGEWRTTGGTLEMNQMVAVEFVENGILLSPGDSMIVHGRVFSPSTDGTLKGVVEIKANQVDDVVLGTDGVNVGGQVLPGKEVSFILTFSQDNSGKFTAPLNDTVGGLTLMLGSVILYLDEKKKI